MQARCRGAHALGRKRFSEGMACERTQGAVRIVGVDRCWAGRGALQARIGKMTVDACVEVGFNARLRGTVEHLVVVYEQPVSLLAVSVQDVAVHGKPDGIYLIFTEPDIGIQRGALLENAGNRTPGFSEDAQEGGIAWQVRTPHRQGVAKARILEGERTAAKVMTNAPRQAGRRCVNLRAQRYLGEPAFGRKPRTPDAVPTKPRS